MGCHGLLQGIFPTQGLNPSLLRLLHCQQILYHQATKLAAAAAESLQSCPTLCDPMDYTVHEILQARTLEWVAFPFFRGSSQPRDRWVDHNAGILHCRQILYGLSQQGSLGRTVFNPKGQSIREPLRLLPGEERVELQFLFSSSPSSHQVPASSQSLVTLPYTPPGPLRAFQCWPRERKW